MLPQDIRDHFLMHGDGEASRNAITLTGLPVDEDEPFLRLSFPSLYHGSLFLHEKSQQMLIQIAVDGQESFCSVLSGSDQGKIVHCHGRPLAGSQLVNRVASTLQEFFDLLDPDPIDDWEKQRGYDDRYWAGKTYHNYEPFLPSQEWLRHQQAPNPTQLVSFTNCQQPVSEEHFKWLEQAFQMRFPLEIREHYQKFNGGSPDKSYFLIDGRVGAIFDFESMQYPVPLGTSGQMMTELGSYEHQVEDWKWRTQFLPVYLWPLATIDNTSDCLCFSSREVDFGAIYIFATEVGVQPPLSKIANSFNEFLDTLQATRPTETP